MPSSAAIPTAPILAGAPAVIVLALGAVVVAEIPLVNGTEETEVAPANATAWVVAVTTGMAVLFEGFRTLDGC
jgi:predicted aconitase with swiveling domain